MTIMHYTVKIESTEQAVKEVCKYLGKKRANKFFADFRDYAFNLSSAGKLRALYGLLGMAGIQGRAVVHGVYRHLFVQNCN